MSFFCIDKPKFGDMLGLKEGDPLENFAEKVSLQFGDADADIYAVLSVDNGDSFSERSIRDNSPKTATFGGMEPRA